VCLFYISFSLFLCFSHHFTSGVSTGSQKSYNYSW
jgi:hypothetical protein